jgi:hypothetical protein
MGPIRNGRSYLPQRTRSESLCSHTVVSTGMVNACRCGAEAGVTRMGRDPSSGLGRAAVFAAR